MISLQRKSGGVLLAAVLAIMWPMAGCAVTTPEIHAKVVDADTGAPQEWVKAIVYAGKLVHTIGGDVEPTLFTKTFYFHAKNGAIVIPSQHFSICDLIRYKDWELVIKSPGHNKVVLHGKGIEASATAGKASLDAKVRPYLDGISWEVGYDDADFNADELPRDTVRGIELKGDDLAMHDIILLEELRDLVIRWSMYARYPSGRMRDNGRLGCAKEYIAMLSKVLQKHGDNRLVDSKKLVGEATAVVANLGTADGAPTVLEELRKMVLTIQGGAVR